MEGELAERPWLTYDAVWGGTHFQQVVPADDIKEHDTTAGLCWCGPVKHMQWGWAFPFMQPVIILIQWSHNSLDGREEVQGPGL